MLWWLSRKKSNCVNNWLQTDLQQSIQISLCPLITSLTVCLIWAIERMLWQQSRKRSNLCRQLAIDRSVVFNPHLTLSLNNLSNHLSNLGHWEDALMAIQEAVELHSQLATAQPAVFNLELAKLLKNLSYCLSDLGHQMEALAAAQNANDLTLSSLALVVEDSFVSVSHWCIGYVGMRSLRLVITLYLAREILPLMYMLQCRSITGPIYNCQYSSWARNMP